MAELFVFDIADSLLGKLTSYAYEHAYRVYGVYEDLQGFKDTLSIVSGMLLDADQKNKNRNKNQQHAASLEWFRQIRNICSDAEDVLDGFELQDKRKKVVKASSSSTKGKVHHFFSSSSNPFLFRLRMARQIKEIRDRLDKVAADGTKFGLVRIYYIHNDDHQVVVQRKELTHSHVDALDVIGRENDREEIIKLLMQLQPHPHGDKSLCVIPIVGIGGLGKTTLAKLVFNDKRTDQLFQLKMWVCVSDDFDIRHIIIKIISSASASTYDDASSAAPTPALAHQQNINYLDIELLQTRLRHKLSRKKFLLVLDDIWNDDRAKWIELKDLMKVGAAGSKIVVTTRSNSIASMMGTVPSYVLEGLSPENCLSLFIKWAFKKGEDEKYQHLVDIGKEIVKKCAGVPLAARTLGSLLFSKFDLSKWEFVRDHDIWNLEQKKEDILPALKLSYDQMPSYLRHCFACFSLYPKDLTFHSVQISIVWVALGLVHHSQNGNEKPEDIAREYIDELNAISFLQDFKDLGYYCTFKLHDLVHDLAIYVAKEDFVMVKALVRNIPEQVRHLSILENLSHGHAMLFPKSKSVRTILFPIKRVGLDSDDSLLGMLVLRYKYLRILDLRDSSFEILPNSIAKLEHLRALDLSNSKIKNLPHSFCSSLPNLQVLSLGGCMNLETLPKGFRMLISLQKLYITTKQCILSLDEFASLHHLTTLGFYRCNNLNFVLSGESQLTSLETLSAHSCGGLESVPLSMFPNLQTLILADCKMLNLSVNNESQIQNLRMKHLYLIDFPQLLTLPGWIVCASNTLETLVIENFPNVKMLPEFITTMTRLKRLHFRACPQLSSLPNDMHCLTALEDLLICGCPELC